MPHQGLYDWSSTKLMVDTVRGVMKKDMEYSNSGTSKIPLADSERKIIPVICPWCNKLFKLSKWNVYMHAKTGVTHGICPECFEKIIKDIEK